MQKFFTIGQEILNLEVERATLRREADLAQRSAPIGVPLEGHVRIGAADVDRRPHDLEIGPHQVEDDAEGPRMIDQGIEAR